MAIKMYIFVFQVKCGLGHSVQRHFEDTLERFENVEVDCKCIYLLLLQATLVL